MCLPYSIHQYTSRSNLSFQLADLSSLFINFFIGDCIAQFFLKIPVSFFQIVFIFAIEFLIKLHIWDLAAIILG